MNHRYGKIKLCRRTRQSSASLMADVVGWARDRPVMMIFADAYTARCMTSALEQAIRERHPLAEIKFSQSTGCSAKCEATWLEQENPVVRTIHVYFAHLGNLTKARAFIDDDRLEVWDPIAVGVLLDRATDLSVGRAQQESINQRLR